MHEVDRDPDLLIAAQPTRGLDVGAIEFIHKRLIEQRDKGKGVLLLSLELDEILNVSDRIAVIYEGKIVAIVDAKETNEQQLGLLMAGEQRRSRWVQMAKTFNRTNDKYFSPSTIRYFWLTCRSDCNVS